MSSGVERHRKFRLLQQIPIHISMSSKSVGTVKETIVMRVTLNLASIFYLSMHLPLERSFQGPRSPKLR
jgi:hypothetical protein